MSGFLSVKTIVIVASVFPFALAGQAQNQQRAGSAVSAPRIAGRIDEDRRVALKEQAPPLVSSAIDKGAVPDNFPLEHMLLLLKRSPEQEQELRQLIDELHDPNSPHYQHWLTPEEVGRQFGPAQQDVSTVAAWLQSHGFRVNAVYPNGLAIDVSGTGGQVRDTFHTQIHHYLVDGAEHIANAGDPQIPAALAPVVSGFSALHDFWPRLLRQDTHTAASARTDTGFQFDFTFGANNTFQYDISPQDFATIFNVRPLWTAAKPIAGKGQTIAILGGSDVQQADWDTFRGAFGLNSFAGTLTQIQPPAPASQAPSGNNNCADPGLLGGEAAGNAEVEAALDVEWAGAVAPDASIVLASCANTSTQFSALIAANNLINGENPPPIISFSAAGCESLLGSLNAYINGLWQQAAAEGITVVVGAGDNGTAGCDNRATEKAATLGLAVSGLASTPYNVAVGGTGFPDVLEGIQGLFWNNRNSATGQSARSYIPETPWNDSCANPFVYLTHGSLSATGFCNSSAGSQFLNIFAGSGGASSLYAKPSWQSGVLGILSDGKRDLPDISFPSDPRFGHAYLICMSDPNAGGAPCNYNDPAALGINATGGGTSIATPIFAGVQALINQRAGGRQGVSNYVLYKLAATEYGASGQPNLAGLAFCNSGLGAFEGPGCIFHDVTAGSNAVPCVAGSPNCYAPAGDTYGVMSTSATKLVPSFSAAPGWDFTTGLGTINVANLVNNWPK